MSEQTKIKHSPAVEGKKHHKVRWIVLAVLLVIVAAVAAWYLIRFEFNRDYQAYIEAPAGAAAQSELAALTDENPNVAAPFQLFAENDNLKLYADLETANVAIYDKRSGETVYSNPVDADADKVANKTNKNYLKSQFLLDYYNAGLTSSTYDSYSMSVALGNFRAAAIEDGIAFIYDVGVDSIQYLTPSYLPTERYEGLYEQLSAQAKKAADIVYEKRDDGYWISATGASRTREMARVSKEFVALGMTKAEYLEMEALAGKEQAETLGFTVTLEWHLGEDNVEAKLPVSAIEERGGGKVYRIQLLPYMAAAGSDENGYMVVPNGSGSLIRFNNGKNSAAVYSQYVYDMDLIDGDYTQTQTIQSVRLPLWGVCRENTSVLATIENGASLAAISADVAGRNNSYNNAFAMFTLRGSELLSLFGAGETAEMPIVEDNYYGEDLVIRYTFLTAENKGYSGLANYYRARLIAENVLSPLEETGDIPFYYDVIGGVKETTHFMGIQYLHVRAMTTFDEAVEIAQSLNKAGIKHQVMNFQGWMNGGYYHDVANNVSVLRQLGGKDRLENLNSAIARLGGELYADVAFQKVTQISKHYMENQETSRYYGAGYIAQFGVTNPASLRRTSALGYSENIYNLLSPKFLPYYVSGFLSSTKDYSLNGYSLRDLGCELHADKRRTELINREQALMIVESQLQAIADSGKNVMVSGGNLYALNGVKHVIDAPMTATEYVIVDETIPLYEMILHGCVDYTGQALNTIVSDDWQAKLLKMVEYGASPRYTFTAQQASDMKYTALNRLYATTVANWTDTAAEQYAYLNAALASVSGAQMVKHTILSDTLRSVEYDNGVTIYINYGSQDAQAGSGTVPAKAYLVTGGAKRMKKLHISMAGKRAVNGYLFILPWLLGFLLFYVRSLYMTVEFSLSDLTVLSTGGYNLEFVGLKNYYEAFFSHASFKQTLTTSIGNMVIDVPLIIFFSLFVAMMLNRKMKCRGLVRAIFFLPVLLGAEAVSNALSLAAQMMAGGLSGTSADMAAASASSGTMNMDYLIDLFAQLALPDVVLDYIVGAVSRISDIIQASGVQIVLFIAGLQSIPSSLYEVAKIEGATGYETFWKVTFRW